MNEPAATDPIESSAKDDHERVFEMLGSPEMQRRLEEARAQREKVLAAKAAAREAALLEQPDGIEEPVQPPTSPAPVVEAAVVQLPVTEAAVAPATAATDAVPLLSERREPKRAVLRAPPRAVVSPEAHVARKAMIIPVQSQPERRRPWIVSLVIGLVAGLALGAGLMRIAGLAPSTIETAAPSEQVTAPQADPGSEPVEEASSRLSNVQPTVALYPSVPTVPGSDDLLAPKPADPPPARPVTRTPGLPVPADDAAVSTASAIAPLDAAEWRPTPLPNPEAEEPPQLALGDTVAGVRPGPALVLAPPSTPDERPAPSLAAVATVPPVAEVPADPPADPGLQVTLLLPPDLSQPALYEARAALMISGVDPTTTSVARFGVARSEVRFFHPDDAADAERIATEMGAEARDFTDYRPTPAPGTLEVRLAQDG